MKEVECLFKTKLDIMKNNESLINFDIIGYYKEYFNQEKNFSVVYLSSTACRDLTYVIIFILLATSNQNYRISYSSSLEILRLRKIWFLLTESLKHRRGRMRIPHGGLGRLVEQRKLHGHLSKKLLLVLL